MVVTRSGAAADNSIPERHRAPLPPWLRELYPFRSHFLNLEGVNLHYLDEGQGPAIVMLHGNPTWSFYFRELIKGLSGRFRVVVPDHVGCGLSDKPANYAYTLSTHIANLARLLDHLSLNNVAFAVHDWGGAIGLGWAVENIDRVRSLVLFNTAAFLGPVPLRIRLCRAPLIGRWIVQRLNGFARAALRMAIARQERLTPTVRAGYLFPYDTPDNRIGMYRFIRDIPLSATAPSRAVLLGIESALPSLRSKPVAICWGARDFCFNDRFLERWRDEFPHAAIHRFEDAGHYVVEDAFERIIPVIENVAATPA
jgi:haloalkane dehalogenase